MDNKDRDKLSRSTTPTSAGDVNRDTSERLHDEKSGNAAEFGNKIGRSEDMSHEPSRRSGSERSSSSSGSDWQSSGSSRSRSSGSGSGDRDRTGSSSGRH